MPIKKLMFITVLLTLPLTTSVFAADSTYRISLKRQSPSEPISLDGIVSAVNDKYHGRILSVQEKQTPSAPDCRIVRMLGTDGEYMSIRVACDG
jgi:hypothetical protein